MSDELILSQIAKLELGPEDVLVFRTSYVVSDATATHIRNLLAEHFNNKVLILDGGADLAVITPAPSAQLNLGGGIGGL